MGWNSPLTCLVRGSSLDGREQRTTESGAFSSHPGEIIPFTRPLHCSKEPSSRLRCSNSCQELNLAYAANKVISTYLFAGRGCFCRPKHVPPCRLLSLPQLTLMEVEKSSASAPRPPHLISDSPHCLCPGSMSTPTFLRASGAGDAALDRAG